MKTKKAEKAPKTATKPGHGGMRANAGAKPSGDPTIQVNGRVKGWVNDWMKAEVEAGRAASISSLVAEFVVAGARAKGAKEPEKS